MIAYRLVKKSFASKAFDGEGARIYGGRWNSTGVPIVYTAGSLSLGLLEILVHVRKPALVEKAYLFFPVELIEDLIVTVDMSKLPRKWRDDLTPESIQQIGDNWVASDDSPILRVPSVIIPQEWNYLLNPEHADFSQIQIHGEESFPVDQRFQNQ